jgi:hypothetical protein
MAGVHQTTHPFPEVLMLRRTLLPALAMLVLAVPACNSDSSTEVEGSVAGTYTVQTIDGHTLPYVVDGESQDAGTLVLKADNTYTVHLTGHVVAGGANISFDDHGTYTVDADGRLVLHSQTDATDTTAGTISGSTITLTDDDNGTVYVLKKS